MCTCTNVQTPEFYGTIAIFVTLVILSILCVAYDIGSGFYIFCIVYAVVILCVHILYIIYGKKS